MQVILRASNAIAQKYLSLTTNVEEQPMGEEKTFAVERRGRNKILHSEREREKKKTRGKRKDEESNGEEEGKKNNFVGCLCVQLRLTHERLVN